MRDLRDETEELSARKKTHIFDVKVFQQVFRSGGGYSQARSTRSLKHGTEIDLRLKRELWGGQSTITIYG